ncbi:prenyltransferase/squalene oxidase repeat-containing protein [Actinomadura sp. 3N407]|uniref:prenyltransferase/squalene oxidase repeat-containing protein n=1 Tax=Actinomadura sp. 3N407 TaxID=3457423 RepID=UPI003FCE9C4F
MLAVLRSHANGYPDGITGSDAEVKAAELAGRLNRVLPMLARRLADMPAAALPDMPANDLITSSLIESINDHLDSLRPLPASGLDPAVHDRHLGRPRGLDGTRLAKVRAALSAGVSVPEKVLHALEVASELARGARTIRPGSIGAIGASPAATAAWLDGRAARDASHPARIFLEAVVDEHAGLAPCGIPITVFERAWVLGTLARAGVEVHVPASLVKELGAALGPGGTPAAEGLPADADTTSATLYALGLLGAPRPPDVLWPYETETHFCTWPGEEGFSVTVNAHVLEAFGQYLHAVGQGESPQTAATERYVATVDKLVALLSDQQEADGTWTDRWHASPYYATMCCVVALDRFGGEKAAPVIRRAREWTLATQRPDGSWGRWEGTAEETAYALQILLSDEHVGGMWDTTGRYKKSVTLGCKFLPAPDRPDPGTFEGPALWHDKDLYLPAAIVRASLLAAQHLANKRGLRPDSH